MFNANKYNKKNINYYYYCYNHSNNTYFLSSQSRPRGGCRRRCEVQCRIVRDHCSLGGTGGRRGQSPSSQARANPSDTHTTHSHTSRGQSRSGVGSQLYI